MPRTADQKRGIDRERALVRQLRDLDWFAMRAPASLGVADVVALRGDRSGRCEARLTDAKPTAAGPYAKFGPADRKKLRETAEMAGAQASLSRWPRRRDPAWTHSTDWPK